MSIEQLRERMPALRQREQMLRAELQAITDQANDRATFLRLAETLTAFLARLRGAADTLSINERQRIVRLVVKDVLIGEDTITIRHSIPVQQGPPQDGCMPPSQSGGITQITFCVRGVMTPLLSNLYLNEVDQMLEKAIATTRFGQYTRVQYARFADDMVLLIDSHPRQDWLVRAVARRVREELAKLKVEINEEKSRMVDLSKGESFCFLGFEYRLIRSRFGKWWPQYVPRLKKRTALLAKLKTVFQRYLSQPVERVIEEINPILRGWVNYFAAGHSSQCFSFISQWVERKIRRHLMRAQGLQGFGWEQWSKDWLYHTLGLFHDYRVRWQGA